MDSLTALNVLIPEERWDWSRCTLADSFSQARVLILQMYGYSIFGASEYSVTSQKTMEKHFNIIRNSSFNLLDLPYVAMLMCVKYKVVSVCYMFGLLLITASCTVCTSLFLFVIYINMYYCTQKSQKAGGSKPVHLFAKQNCF